MKSYVLSMKKYTPGYTLGQVLVNFLVNFGQLWSTFKFKLALRACVTDSLNNFNLKLALRANVSLKIFTSKWHFVPVSASKL